MEVRVLRLFAFKHEASGTDFLSRVLAPLEVGLG